MRRMRKAKRLAIMVQVVRAQGLLPMWTYRDNLPFQLANSSQGRLIQMGGIPMIVHRNPSLLKEPPPRARLLVIRECSQKLSSNNSFDEPSPEPQATNSWYRASSVLAKYGVLF